MKLFFYEFKPILTSPQSIQGFREWWKAELRENAEAVPEEEVLITTSGPAGENLAERTLQVYQLWLGLKNSHEWLKGRL